MILVRLARSSDLAFYEDCLEDAVWRRRYLGPNDSRSSACVAAEMLRPNDIVAGRFVAVRGDEPMGFVHWMRRSPFELEGSCGVHPKYIGRGFAIRIAAAGIAIAYNRLNAKTLVARVASDHSASRRMIERLGFRQIALTDENMTEYRLNCDESASPFLRQVAARYPVAHAL